MASRCRSRWPPRWRCSGACAASGATYRRRPAARRSPLPPRLRQPTRCCASSTWTAATARAATTRTTPIPRRAGAAPPSPSSALFFALPPPTPPPPTPTPSPSARPSLPKLRGAVGGISLSLGTAGLWRLNLRRHPLHGDAAQQPMDRGFIALLFLTATSGLALWAARGTPALALLLCLHLGAVMALFATLPYGKFAHGIFRTAALLRHAVEKRQPSPIGLGAD